jgi:TatD DNase family protein
MIDTHSHIYLPEFNSDLEGVLDRATEVDITDIFMPAVDFTSIQQMQNIHHSHINFYKMAGLHPADIKELPEHLNDHLFQLCKRSDIYGVGETGLDYYWSTEYVDEQKESLHTHCNIAKEVNKPIILHNRESTRDVLSIIESEQDGSLTGIWHCFNGSVDEGKRAIDLGLHLGIGGVVTFKNGGVDKSVAQLPLEKMVLETDAPYLTPSPHLGKRNEPSFMNFTAQTLSEIFDISIQEIKDKTSHTARKLFNI